MKEHKTLLIKESDWKWTQLSKGKWGLLDKDGNHVSDEFEIESFMFRELDLQMTKALNEGWMPLGNLLYVPATRIIQPLIRDRPESPSRFDPSDQYQ